MQAKRLQQVGVTAPRCCPSLRSKQRITQSGGLPRFAVAGSRSAYRKYVNCSRCFVCLIVLSVNYLLLRVFKAHRKVKVLKAH